MGDNEIKMAQMQKDIDYIKRDMGEFKNVVVTLPQKIDDAIDMLTKEFDRREERYEKKFAPISLWNATITVAKVVTGIVVTIVVYLIFKYGHTVL